LVAPPIDQVTSSSRSSSRTHLQVDLLKSLVANVRERNSATVVRLLAREHALAAGHAVNVCAGKGRVQSVSRRRNHQTHGFCGKPDVVARESAPNAPRASRSKRYKNPWFQSTTVRGRSPPFPPSPAPTSSAVILPRARERIHAKRKQKTTYSPRPNRRAYPSSSCWTTRSSYGTWR
jgi:hypothetical protein